MARKEFNNLPEIKDSKWYGLTKKQWIWTVISLVFIGILLNIITVLTVYYGFCGETPTIHVHEMLIPVNRTEARQNPDNLNQNRSALSMIKGRNANATAERINNTTDAPCPTQPPAINCSPQPICKEGLPPTCPPTKLCDCPTCVTCHVCTTTTIPPIFHTMLEKEIVGMRPFDLLRGEPPGTHFSPNAKYGVGSYERLQVAMNLMENFFERYYKLLTKRSCTNDMRRICLPCRNRYQYLGCIYNGHLAGQAEEGDKLGPYANNTMQKWINMKTYSTSFSGKWGKDFWNRLSVKDFYNIGYFDFKNSMTLMTHPTHATNPRDGVLCTPCDDGRGLSSYAACLANKEKNKPDWHWENHTLYAQLT